MARGFIGTMLRKYAAGTGADVYVQLYQTGTTAFAESGDWTPAAGDVKVSKDGGAEANIATLPTFANGWWKFVFSDAEVTAKRTAVRIVDAALEDAAFVVETTQHVSAMHPAESDLARAAHRESGSIGEGHYRTQAVAGNKKIANQATGATEVMEDDGTTLLETHTLQDGATDNEVEHVTT